MRYLILLLVAVMVLGIGYIYIAGAPDTGYSKKKKGDNMWSPVDEFLAEPEPQIADEPKVISIDDFEAEKERRYKKKD